MSDNEAALDPNNAPKGDTGIKTVNRIPLFIVFGILLLLVVGLGYATMKRGEVSSEDKDKDKAVSPVSEASVSLMLDDWYQSRFKKKDGTPPVLLAKEENLTKSDAIIEAKIDEAALKLSQLKHDMYLKSLSAPTSISMKTSGITSNGNNALKNALSSIDTGSLDLIKQLHEQKLSIEDENTLFMKQKNSFDYLPSKKTAAYSKYEIKTGTLIPGILITGINSKLPGAIKAQVSENVYDTATGNYLLIPQGTTIVGKYSSHVQFGQDRVLISWNRLIFTDGHTLNIGNMNGIDQQGYTGFEDQVDNHYFQIFGSAFLLSLLSGDFFFEDGYLVISGQTSSGTQTTPSPLEQAAAQMIQKQLSVSPTIEIRPGYKFNIFVTKDIILEPLKN